jgi:hypothetical protein
MAVGAVDGLRERWEGAWGMAERECDSGRGGLMLFGHSNGGQGENVGRRIRAVLIV